MSDVPSTPCGALSFEMQIEMLLPVSYDNCAVAHMMRIVMSSVKCVTHLN